MSVDLDVAGSEDDAIARNFLVLPQVDDVSHLVKRVRLEILNVEKTTLPCACTLSLIQCHSVWGINWRTESLQGMFIFTLLDSTMSHLTEMCTLIFMLLITLVASPWTTETSKEFARLSSLCLKPFIVINMVWICLQPYSSLVVVRIVITKDTQCVGVWTTVNSIHWLCHKFRHEGDFGVWIHRS